jgi:hypothetical protein
MRISPALFATALLFACCVHASAIQMETRQVVGSHNGWVQGPPAAADAPVTLVFAVKQQQLQVCPILFDDDTTNIAVRALLFKFPHDVNCKHGRVQSFAIAGRTPLSLSLQLLETMFWDVSTPSAPAYGRHLTLQVCEQSPVILHAAS